MENEPTVKVDWLTSSATQQLLEDTVDIWRVDLSNPIVSVRDVLSAEEVRRSGRFYHQADREQWSRCRSALRRILAGYLETDPKSLCFGVSQFGKPYLTNLDRTEGATERIDGEHLAPLYFNVSHSGSIGLIAVAKNCPVGIDVERVDRSFDPVELAPSVFSTDEIANLMTASTHSLIGRFLEIWTRKEAWLKMNGLGLIDDMNAYSVLDVAGISQHLKPALIINLDVGEKAWAALAVATPISLVRLFDFC